MNAPEWNSTPSKQSLFIYSSLNYEVSKPSNWYLPIPFDDPKPIVPLVYGFPNHIPSATPEAAASEVNVVYSNELPLEPPFLPNKNPNPKA